MVKIDRAPGPQPRLRTRARVAALARASRAARSTARAAAGRLRIRVRAVGGERGQSTTEYTLVMLVAATVVLLLLNWVKGGALVGFFQSIFDKVVAMFE